MANDSYQRRLVRLAALILTIGLVATTLSIPAAAAVESNSSRSGVSGDDNPGAAAKGGSTGAPEVEVQSSSSDREVAEASVASLQVDRAAVRSQLAEAKAARDRQFDRWALTHLAAEAARAELQRSSMAAEQARQQVVVAQDRVREYAMEAFMNPPALASMAVLAVADAEQVSRAHDLMSITAEDKGRVVGELSAAHDAAERSAALAKQAAASSAERETASKSELEALEEAVRTQQRLGAQIDQRLDGAMAEVAALREVDRKAAGEMEAQEVALASESRSALDAGAAGSGAGTKADAADSAAGDSTAMQTKPVAPKPSGPPPAPPPGTVTWSDVTKVGTFWVHRSIASNVQGLVSAASAAGFNLTGGGFRDPASQISLRQAHCGSSYYDIYQKPASQCTPPTAIPGRSMHEQGRALDIKSGGALITSRSDPAFQWLAANAASYGLYNLPSEPWHWSTNGT